MRGLRVDVCADIEQHRVTLRARNDCRERRPAHSFDRADEFVRRRHRRAGMSGAHHRIGLSFGHECRADAHRRIFFLAQRRERGVFHLDDIARVDDGDRARHRSIQLAQFFLHDFLSSDQDDVGSRFSSGEQSAFDDLQRCVIAAHGVDGDAACGGSRHPFSAR